MLASDFIAAVVPDILFTVGLIFFLHWFAKGKHIPILVDVLIVLAMVLHLAGSFGLYAHFLFGVIGYDKLVHFVSGAAMMAYALVVLFEKYPRRYVFALLILLGAGAITELLEFIGTYYFGIDNGGIFAISDSLPIVSGLQRYDTYFDMLTNLIGGMVTMVFVIGYRNLRKK